MQNNIILDTRLVGQITGDFIVKSYQRGYRWGTEEVERLLEDIYTNGEKNYCLQPIVVKKENEQYELIDGQQRLTTIFLIYQYMYKTSKGFMPAPKFTIDYETRENTREFLENINIEKQEENIDFYFIANAYKTIDNWFSLKGEAKVSTLTTINQYFDKNVKVIWYEVDNSVDTIALFTRLNIGKIPLTSAELVKAMFLSHDANEELTQEEYVEKQEEISLQWDNIEKQLHDERLWYFLTNNISKEYQTRIDLILDLISNNNDNIKEKYYTYFYIENIKKEKTLKEIWSFIQHTFLILNDWYENHELYHKVGYLIASEHLTLNNIFKLSEDKKKDEFINLLNAEIKKSIKVKDNYSEYSYNNSSDKIARLLLLFNIESVRQNGEKTQWFPFDKHKMRNNGKAHWSLEHIHAQQSEGMKTQEAWIEWIKLHLDSIKLFKSEDNKDLIQEMEHIIELDKIDSKTFERIQEKVLNKLSVNTKYDKHSIANLALLNTSDNSALNNSTFDVKRNKIIEMDKSGKYIPFCTKMVFFKYYTKSEENQLHFWGQKDMEAYIDAINNILKDFLDGNIIKFEMEGEEND